jgi:hypothetical protein
MNMRLRLWLTALISIVAALLMAGCGGGSSTDIASDSKSSNSIALAALIEKADRICVRLDEKFTGAQGRAQTNHAVAHVVPLLVAAEREALVELSKLTPPASIAGDWQTMLADRQTLIGDFNKLGEYAKLNNSTDIKSAATSIEGQRQRMLAIAKRDGFQECSRLAG